MRSLIVPIIVSMLLFSFLVGFAICCFPTRMTSEYSTQISVDKLDKLENAISNVMSDLEKRDFIPVNLNVMLYPTTKTYKIKAGGIDRTHLGKYEP